jgi:2-oxoglutarate dehydrogenase E2 component (dihydrolipoamide succinyltransferase)
MPQMGESVVEGTILTWLKHEGDDVAVDDPLVEVSTDKVDTEIPSPVAGKLTKILVAEGDTVEIGTALCEVDESGNGAASTPAADAKAEQTEAEPSVDEVTEKVEEEPSKEERAAAKTAGADGGSGGPQSEAEPPRGARLPPGADGGSGGPQSEAEPPRGARLPPGEKGASLSPLVRKLAREHDVDLAQVRGTGSGGRITRDDVLAYAESAPKAPSAPAGDGKAAAASAPQRAGAPPTREGAGERTSAEPLTHIRKRIAQHMRASLDSAARAWNAIEVDMESVAQVRARFGEEFKKREGYSLTYLPFIARAVWDALAEHPIVNASLSDDLSEATYHHYVNLGIAVATDYGLIVPVVKGAEALTVTGLSRAVRDLADRARDKKLDPDDVGGSTFTITNPGPFDSYLSLPVINQPNVAILATEKVEKRVVVVDDMIAIRHRTFLSMSWDHRLLDGVPAMQFLQRVKTNLETWDFSHEV